MAQVSAIFDVLSRCPGAETVFLFIPKCVYCFKQMPRFRRCFCLLFNALFTRSQCHDDADSFLLVSSVFDSINPCPDAAGTFFCLLFGLEALLFFGVDMISFIELGSRLQAHRA